MDSLPTQNRRSFLRTLLTGAAAVAVAPYVPLPSRKAFSFLGGIYRAKPWQEKFLIYGTPKGPNPFFDRYYWKHERTFQSVVRNRIEYVTMTDDYTKVEDQTWDALTQPYVSCSSS